MKTSSNIGFSTILGIIFFLALFVIMFFRDIVFDLIAPDPMEISDSKKASREVAEALLRLDKISLDTSILKTNYFSNVVILPTFPTDSKTLANFGKINPFLGSFVAVSSTPGDTSTTTVGGVIYSQQRSVNNGNSVVPVQNGRGQAPQGRR